jgi:hypothetical protein
MKEALLGDTLQVSTDEEQARPRSSLQRSLLVVE